ncbi:co-chaperone GroES [Sulfobacillus harzensis]|uniref:Co-chaperonin GroES n=1 Tax=Sulfobacillus harzensis TaxID=2729629 RepID=A0A7Y0L5Y6_9FIRM|nr:co-chaperone GroES [Sulfobacillus harzensis]
MDIRPLSDHLVVKPITEEKTVAGIVLPDTAKDQLQRAEVLAVGSGRLLENGSRAPLEVKVGDVVIFNGDFGRKVRVNDQDYLLIRESDIVAVLATQPVVA